MANQQSPAANKLVKVNNDSDAVQAVRRRVEMAFTFMQGNDTLQEFSPPFNLTKIENIIKVFFSKVTYTGQTTPAEMALLVKARAGPSYVELATNSMLIDAIMKERALVELLAKL